MRVENNNRCFACGKENPVGLQVNPDIAPDGRQVRIECTPTGFSLPQAKQRKRHSRWNPEHPSR